MAERESKTTAIPTTRPQPHRRHDRFRRGIFDLTKLYTEQNKMIIDLLTEIRDRLPKK